MGLVYVEDDITDAEPVLDDLHDLADDPRVEALVVRINSPGGNVGASQEIYSGIQRVRRESGKPVIASLGDVAASGGYYVACATESVFADPGTLTGSIGVIMEMPEVGGLLEKVGVRMQVVKSGRLKDIGSMYRSMTPEETLVLQGVIDDTFGQFVDAVAEGRRLPRARVLAVADGRVMTGRQAVRAGLVDRLGDLEDAVRAAGQMAEIKGRPHIARRVHHRWPWDFLYSKFAGAEQHVFSGPRLLYRVP